MTQISRPFQIALAAFVLIALVWFVALRGHSSGESSGSPAPVAAQPATPATPASSSATHSASSPSTAASGSSAPGVNGLTRAIAKARGAAAQSEQNAKRLAQKEQQAANSAGAHSSPATSTTAGSQPAARTAPPVAAKAAPTVAAKAAPTVAAAKARSATAAASAKAKSGVPAGQTKVEGQLKQDKDVAILLWNPKGSVDSVVRRELQVAARTFSGSLAVHVALASQVGSFGTFTRAVQVYSTPTILLIEPKGVTSSVTGLIDAFAIEQDLRELRQAH